MSAPVAAVVVTQAAVPSVQAQEDEPVSVTDDSSSLYSADKEVIVEEGTKYVAVFDPLDGSSNVDANIPTGTIFGIFEVPDDCDVRTPSDASCSLSTPSPDPSLADLRQPD